MLEQQTRHHSDRKPRTTIVLAVQALETILKQLLGNLPGQLNQRMIPATGISQGKTKHFTLILRLGLGRDHLLLLNIARNQAMIIQFLAFSGLFFCISLILFFNKIKSLYISNRVFQGRLIEATVDMLQFTH